MFAADGDAGDDRAAGALAIQNFGFGNKTWGYNSFGAPIKSLGIGGLKLKLHRACIGRLFQSSDQVLDAEEIYALAKTMT